MAWKFVQDNWDELYNRYEGGFLLCRLVKVISVVFFVSTLVDFNKTFDVFSSS